MKFLTLIAITSLSINSLCYASPKRCEIKFGETKNKEAIEKEYFSGILSESIRDRYGMECYQIGVEHDEQKNPIPNKRIYACCSKILPEE